uniref:Insulin n=1 Tax=Labrus bergylta TaxID=56723 RepID=A0A3Q3KVF2_9LABR
MNTVFQGANPPPPPEASCMFYDASSRFRAADSSEDPFSSRQDESSEGVSHNFVVEETTVFSRKARSFITEEILEALRKADRKGRDVVVGLSNACCKWGCSKSEISSLC